MQVLEESCINRVITSIMRFTNAFKTLVFTSLLSHTTFDILADGVHFHIKDPYDKPSVTVRKPGSNAYKRVSCMSCDLRFSPSVSSLSLATHKSLDEVPCNCFGERPGIHVHLVNHRVTVLLCLKLLEMLMQGTIEQTDLVMFVLAEVADLLALTLLSCQVPLDREDMYNSEASAFVEAIRSGDKSSIHSPYADAVGTLKTSLWNTAASSTEAALHRSTFARGGFLGLTCCLLFSLELHCSVFS